jgi:hypothetical protein
VGSGKREAQLYSMFCRLRFGTAPATEERKKARCSSAAFPKLFNAGFSCYNVTPLPENRIVALPPCLPLDIKDLLKKDTRLFG